MPRTRYTKKTVTDYISELIADGTLPSCPLNNIGGDIGHGTRFIFVDSYVALGPRQAIEYIELHAEELARRITRLNDAHTCHHLS